MLDRGKALVGSREFGFLQLDERGHVLACIAVGQVEHRVVQAVETGQRDELEFVAHRTEFALELGDGRCVEVALPVERGRAVVGQHLARELLLDGFGKLLGKGQIRLAGLAPDQIGIRRISQAARDRLLDTRTGPIEALDRALAGDEGLVVVVDIRGDQVGGFGIGTRQQHGRRAHHIGSQTGCGELGNRFTRGHQHLATHVSAFLDSRQLVFEVNARGAGFDHGFHQFEGIEHAAETGFGIGHDRGEIVGVALLAGILAFHPLDLVAAGQRVVDLLDDLRHRVDRIQRLVGIHFTGQIGVAGDLPARKIDRLQAGLDLLHCLVAGERSQRVHEGLFVDQLPEFFGATLGQRVLDCNRAAQTHDVGSRVAALDTAPAGVIGPLLLELLGFEFT